MTWYSLTRRISSIEKHLCRCTTKPFFEICPTIGSPYTGWQQLENVISILAASAIKLCGWLAAWALAWFLASCSWVNKRETAICGSNLPVVNSVKNALLSCKPRQSSSNCHCSSLTSASERFCVLSARSKAVLPSCSFCSGLKPFNHSNNARRALLVATKPSHSAFGIALGSVWILTLLPVFKIVPSLASTPLISAPVARLPIWVLIV